MNKSFKFIISILLISFFISCEDTVQQTLPVIENFSVSPLGTWHVEDVVTLSWSVKNADSVTIDNGIGSVPLTGTYQYTLTTPGYFNFTLTAVNDAGSVDRAIPYAVEQVQVYSIWEQWFTGIRDAEPHDMIKCLNGDFLIVGVTGYNIYEPSSKVFLTRFGPEGNMIWEKHFRKGDGCYGQTAAEMQDGSFIVAANNRYTNPPQNDYLFYLFQATSDGGLVWEKNIGGYHLKTWDCAANEDGSYLIAGESYDLGGNPYLKQLYLGQFRNSKPIWEKTFSSDGPSESESSGRKMLKTADGGYAVIGTNWTEEQDKNIYLIKTDGSGVLEWQKTFGTAAPFNEEGKDIVECKDGGFLLLGSTDKQIEGDIYIIKTDSAGNVEWEMTQGGPLEDKPASMINCSDGNYLALWNTVGQQSDCNATTSMNILKFDIKGNVVWRTERTRDILNCLLYAQKIIETGNKEFMVMHSAECMACCPHFATYTLLEEVRLY